MSDDVEDEFPDPVVRNPPRKIFLVVGNIEEDCSFSELGEVSWAEEQICDADIEYALAPQREIDGLMAKIYDFEEKIAHLEDLRRWRPMSEHPTGEREAHITRRRGHDSLVGVTKFDFDEGEWAWPRHSEETDWEWTYIPGQEPKEEA